jgi:sulfur carrier protein ThiS
MRHGKSDRQHGMLGPIGIVRAGSSEQTVVILNGVQRILRGKTLGSLASEQNIPLPMVMIVINGEVVGREAIEGQALHGGDAVEIVGSLGQCLMLP